jgi:transposase
MEEVEVQAYVANYYPLIGRLIEQTGMVSILTQMLDSSNQEVVVDAGTVIAGLIHNILSREQIRLYRLVDFWRDKPMPLMFPWNEQLSTEAINEDRAGRVLDSLHRAGCQKVLSAVMKQVIKQYQLDTSQIHYDTTSKGFYGIYPTQHPEQGPQLVHGLSKDWRPDLVQLLFGVTMSKDGVLLAGSVESGNEQDMKLNHDWIKQIRQQLSLEENQFLLYIADGAVVCEENLAELHSYKIDFISRFPQRYSLANSLIERALAEDQWQDLGSVAESNTAAQYKGWQTTAELFGRNYRFLILRSDNLKLKETRVLERVIAREQESLQKALDKIELQTYSTLEETEKVKKLFYGQQKLKLNYHLVEWSISEEDELVRRSHRGRPKKGEKPSWRRVYKVKGNLLPNSEAVASALAKCGIYILITSLDADKYPPKSLLLEYKQQYLPERMHAFLKNPQAVGAFCLKKPERIIAFGYVLLMAAMIYTLLERQVRKALENRDELPVLGLDKRPTHLPTSWAIFTALTSILIIALPDREAWSLRPSRPLSLNQARILKLAGFSPDIYFWRGPLLFDNFISPPP